MQHVSTWVGQARRLRRISISGSQQLAVAQGTGAEARQYGRDKGRGATALAGKRLASGFTWPQLEASKDPSVPRLPVFAAG